MRARGTTATDSGRPSHGGSSYWPERARVSGDLAADSRSSAYSGLRSLDGQCVITTSCASFQVIEFVQGTAEHVQRAIRVSGYASSHELARQDDPQLFILATSGQKVATRLPTNGA